MRAFALLLAAALPASAETLVVTYICEGGATVRAAYVNDADPQLAVIATDGAMLALPLGMSGSGARYAGPEDRPHHVWHTKGAGAFLDFYDDPAGAPTSVLRGCGEVNAPAG